MRHPQTLMEVGRGGPVALFARNKLCALAQPDLAVDTASLLSVMLDEKVRVGTSTSKADPSGEDRKSVVWGKSVSVRVDLVVRRLIKQKIYKSHIHVK